MVNLILIENSVLQPQLEGFFACLDIWTVFLDYLIGKVANARSDKLAEAEATVSRFVNQTHFMIFKPIGKKLNQTLSIKINDQEIEKVKCTKCFGLYIDDELSWKYYIDKITTKILKMTGIMAKARHYLSVKTLKTIYNTMIYPYLTYCSIIWTSTYPTRLKSIFTIQKK